MTREVLVITFNTFPNVWSGIWNCLSYFQANREANAQIAYFRSIVQKIASEKLGDRGMNETVAWFYAMYELRAHKLETKKEVLDLYIAAPEEIIAHLKSYDVKDAAAGWLTVSTCHVELLESESKISDRHYAYVLRPGA